MPWSLLPLFLCHPRAHAYGRHNCAVSTVQPKHLWALEAWNTNCMHHNHQGLVFFLWKVVFLVAKKRSKKPKKAGAFFDQKNQKSCFQLTENPNICPVAM